MNVRSSIVRIAATTCLLLTSGASGSLRAQHAKPTFRFMPAAEAIRLYWTDGPNQFKAVRAATPHDSEPNGVYSTVRYDLLAVPQGAPVWDEFGEHPLVTEKRGRSELRGGVPQLNLGLTIARVKGRAQAEALFRELRATVQVLPGAQPRGDQEPFYVSVGIKARPGRRALVLQLSDEPEDGVYELSLNVWFNEDDPLWDGGEGA